MTWPPLSHRWYFYWVFFPSLLSSKNVFISPSFLKESLDSKLTLPTTSHTSAHFQYLKDVVTLSSSLHCFWWKVWGHWNCCFLYVIYHFFPFYFKDVLFYFGQQFDYDEPKCGYMCIYVSWTSSSFSDCKFMSLQNLGQCWPLFLPIFYSTLYFIFSWDSNYRYVLPFTLLSQSLKLFSFSLNISSVFQTD